MRDQAMALFQEEDDSMEIVRLRAWILSDRQRMVLEQPSLQEDFLYQSAFHEIDTYCSQRSSTALENHPEFHRAGMEPRRGADTILGMEVRERIARARTVPEAEWPKEYEAIMAAIRDESRLEAV